MSCARHSRIDWTTALQHRLDHGLTSLERLRRMRGVDRTAVVIDVAGIDLPDDAG